MIAVLQNNATNAEDMLLLKHRLRKHDITIKFFPNQVMTGISELQTVFFVVVEPWTVQHFSQILSLCFFLFKVMRSFLPSSPYRNMQPLFIGQTVLFVSKEPKAKEMLQVLRNTPQMLLLGELFIPINWLLNCLQYAFHIGICNRVTRIVFSGACIENMLLSREGILNYSKMPSMRSVHGELIGGLTLMTSHTVSMLHRHPAHLSALLQQYIKQQQGADNAKLEAEPKTEEVTAWSELFSIWEADEIS